MVDIYSLWAFYNGLALCCYHIDTYEMIISMILKLNLFQKQSSILREFSFAIHSLSYAGYTDFFA